MSKRVDKNISKKRRKADIQAPTISSENADKGPRRFREPGGGHA